MHIKQNGNQRPSLGRVRVRNKYTRVNKSVHHMKQAGRKTTKMCNQN